MVTFVSSSDHYPRCQHDGPLNRGHPRPAVGSHPCCCSYVAPLGLGGGVGCVPGGARNPGGGVLRQAIDRYTIVPGPQYREFSLDLGHRLINTLRHFSCNSLMPFQASPYYKACATNASIPVPHRSENNTKMTDKIYFDCANSMDVELIMFGLINSMDVELFVI